MMSRREERGTVCSGAEKKMQRQNGGRRHAGWVLAAFACALFVPSAMLGQPQAQAVQKAPLFERVRIDALDPDSWNGVVFLAKAYGQSSNFALRFGTFSVNTFIDGPLVLDEVREVGPHAPDASYCRLSWQVRPRNSLVTLEWSRIDAVTVVGRITALPDFQFILETYIPFAPATAWGLPGVFSLEEGKPAITGRYNFDAVFGTTSQFRVQVDRPIIGRGTFPSLDHLRETMKGANVLVQSLDSDASRNAAGLQFTTGNSLAAHFVAILGWDKEQLATRAEDLLTEGKIDAILKDKSEAYANKRPSAQGVFESAPEIIGNNMFWNSLYATRIDSIFPSITRKWAHGSSWVLGEWDGFLGSLLSSLEDKDQSWATVRAVLSAQSLSGLVPNVPGGPISVDRSQPPVGSYCVWKLYQRHADLEELGWAYARLKRWHEWWFADRGDGQPWRDGNHDGLLEWGSDRGASESSGGRGFQMHARWESGMDDNPMWDEVHYDPKTYTMDLDDVGLNSLYALDAESLAALAGILGKADDQKQFQADYQRMKQLVREKLWNDKDGIYENRFWNGEFSKRLSPSSFYPMLAGIATPEQAERMVREHLLNPQEFWGEYVIPTTTRSDPAFSDQYYWRGSIWGPTNYLVYHAIDRYGYDQVAQDFAAKSYALFQSDWKTNQHDDELYHAWGGSGGGDVHYTWGALLCLIPLEQMLDDNPWSGLRFGAWNPSADGSLRGIIWQGHSYEVTIGPRQTVLQRDGRERFRADAGIVAREYTASASSVSAKVNSERGFQWTSREFEDGIVTLKIDGQAAKKRKVEAGSVTFAVPRGQHAIELARE
jgi:Mannosylglycerate hydrolase MGH1-like glycoside hydrolase domain